MELSIVESISRPAIDFGESIRRPNTDIDNRAKSSEIKSAPDIDGRQNATSPSTQLKPYWRKKRSFSFRTTTSPSTFALTPLTVRWAPSCYKKVSQWHFSHKNSTLLSAITPRYLSIVEVSHAAVGGVTAAVTHIARYRKVDPPPKPGTVPLAVPRDASTVLAFTKTVRHYRRAPVVKVFEMPVLTNLGPLEAPFYHSGGLLPFPLDTAVRVLIPTLFSRDGCWGLRTVSATEVLLALDVSDALIPRFAAVSNTLLKSLLPGRALVASYKALFPDTEGHPVREGLMVTGGVGMLEDKQSFERLEEKKSCAAEVAEDARSPPKASGPTGMDGAKEAVELRKGAGVIATDAILRQTERKEREKAAVKHDDAQVPEYLWVEHMLQDFEWKIKNGERRVWSQTELADIPEYLTVLRRWALSWWKQNLLREFERYLGEDVSAMAMKHPQVVEWNSKKVRYCWIPTSGRSSYVSWYRGRWGLRPQDMEAGGDAIRRA